MTTYLITGASRGLGLAYTRSLLESNESTRIVAAVRNPDNGQELDSIKKEFGERVYVVKCDVVDQESTKAAAEALEQSGFVQGGLDAVLANAGVIGGGFKSSTQFSKDELDHCLAANLYGVKYTVDAFLPLLKKGKGKQIFVTSSIVGSIGDPRMANPMAGAYAISKAAVNMYTVKLARELADDGFTVIPFHPGYVKTDMNQKVNGDIEVKEAGDLATKNIFLAVTPKDNGKFKSYDGTEIPW